MKVALGGERVGSGNKMNLHLRHYERSTHNLSQGFKSTMGIGALYPFLVIPALRGDKFDIDLKAGIRTIPTKGAMFGTYKLQLDVYQCPVRLYTGILHNNPVHIGLNMDRVLFPQMELRSPSAPGGGVAKTNTSSLLHYLGLSGLGVCFGNPGALSTRRFNAVPLLAYYDIFKNYYSNKQEDYAYVITTDPEGIQTGSISEAIIQRGDDDEHAIELEIQEQGEYQWIWSPFLQPHTENYATLYLDGSIYHPETTQIQVFESPDGTAENERRIFHGSIEEFSNSSLCASMDTSSLQITIEFNEEDIQTDYYRFSVQYKTSNQTLKSTSLQPFLLENIDKMRAELLSWHTMGAPYLINNFAKYPYEAVANSTGASILNEPLQGLCIKTYQSDMFNNWLSVEYIDGVNGIAQLTKVNTDGGGFTIDTLNFSEKMYNLLNRIVVSGGTYDDWQDVVYEDTPKKHLESPMYLGGLSQEIVFEEIVQTATTEQAALGSIGGRGISRHRKGGHIRVKVDEASFIIGIVSITPRIGYSQGNEFYMTDVLSMDDFHKPALDGIGFQDLIGERLAFFDTEIRRGEIKRRVIGKLPAWIEYMTAVDKIHGEFAEPLQQGYMVLDRQYKYTPGFGIDDATTYVDPEKYNSCWAYEARDAQNFWCQIESTIIARRKMSAKQIPNI